MHTQFRHVTLQYKNYTEFHFRPNVSIPHYFAMLTFDSIAACRGARQRERRQLRLHPPSWPGRHGNVGEVVSGRHVLGEFSGVAKSKQS